MNDRFRGQTCRARLCHTVDLLLFGAALRLFEGLLKSLTLHQLSHRAHTDADRIVRL